MGRKGDKGGGGVEGMGWRPLDGGGAVSGPPAASVRLRMFGGGLAGRGREAGETGQNLCFTLQAARGTLRMPASSLGASAHSMGRDHGRRGMLWLSGVFRNEYKLTFT